MKKNGKIDIQSIEPLQEKMISESIKRVVATERVLADIAALNLYKFFN